MMQNLSNTWRDGIIMLILSIIAYLLARRFDALEHLVDWSRQHENYEIDEIISTAIILVFMLLIFSIRRWRESTQKGQDLQKALNEINTLKGILPICSYCKKIRDDAGSWNRLENYLRSHSTAEFSHGICPDCYETQRQTLK